MWCEKKKDKDQGKILSIHPKQFVTDDGIYWNGKPEKPRVQWPSRVWNAYSIVNGKGKLIIGY